MGLLYTAWALEPEMVSWLDSLGIKATGPSRDPTPREVRAALESLVEFSVRYEVTNGDYWSAWVQHRQDPKAGPWALVHISHIGGDDEERRVWFEKGDALLIVRIIERLTQRCGTLVLTCDAGGEPIVITPGTNAAAALDVWRAKPAGVE
jgi:hypothetical protein